MHYNTDTQMHTGAATRMPTGAATRMPTGAATRMPSHIHTQYCRTQHRFFRNVALWGGVLHHRGDDGGHLQTHLQQTANVPAPHGIVALFQTPVINSSINYSIYQAQNLVRRDYSKRKEEVALFNKYDQGHPQTPLLPPFQIKRDTIFFYHPVSQSRCFFFSPLCPRKIPWTASSLSPASEK